MPSYLNTIRYILIVNDDVKVVGVFLSFFFTVVGINKKMGELVIATCNRISAGSTALRKITRESPCTTSVTRPEFHAENVDVQTVPNVAPATMRFSLHHGSLRQSTRSRNFRNERVAIFARSSAPPSRRRITQMRERHALWKTMIGPTHNKTQDSRS